MLTVKNAVAIAATAWAVTVQAVPAPAPQDQVLPNPVGLVLGIGEILSAAAVEQPTQTITQTVFPTSTEVAVVTALPMAGCFTSAPDGSSWVLLTDTVPSESIPFVCSNMNFKSIENGCNDGFECVKNSAYANTIMVKSKVGSGCGASEMQNVWYKTTDNKWGSMNCADAKPINLS